jgi:DNA-binding MarR family transcriptional regulator
MPHRRSVLIPRRGALVASPPSATPWSPLAIVHAPATGKEVHPPPALHNLPHDLRTSNILLARAEEAPEMNCIKLFIGGSLAWTQGRLHIPAEEGNDHWSLRDRGHSLTIARGPVMSDTLIQKKRNESKQEIVLRLLEQVEADDSVSQDRFAKRVGIAKGLANAYFNRCLQKGWIRLRQVPKQRFLYYVTPKGFAEKARLTAEFLTSSYQFYRNVRADMGALMAEAAKDGHKRLAVLGAEELAEIIAIVSEESPVEIAGFIAADSTRTRIAGRPVVADWSSIEAADGAVLATFEDARSVYDDFCAEQPKIPVFVPRQLRSLVWGRPK